jgi:hypothetical protein
MSFGCARVGASGKNTFRLASLRMTEALGLREFRRGLDLCVVKLVLATVIARRYR